MAGEFGRRYGGGVVARVQAAAGGPVDAVFDVAGKTPVEDLVSLAPEPSRSSASPTSTPGGPEPGTGGGADSHPMDALALVAELLAQNKLVVKVQTFPFERAAEAYRISQGGHDRASSSSSPDPAKGPPALTRASHVEVRSSWYRCPSAAR